VSQVGDAAIKNDSHFLKGLWSMNIVIGNKMKFKLDLEGGY
jgi:hypothetical protein